METNNKKQKKEKVKRFTFFKAIKILFVAVLMGIVALGTIMFGMTISILKNVPDIDVTNINSSLNQTSTIYDKDGNLLEKIETLEYRTIVGIDKMPKHLQNAFIAIEDERFESHPGIDPRGIVAALVNNFTSGSMNRGASTITQQLVRNLYLSNDRKLSRKINEAYLSLEMETMLTKEQILEAYLNRISLGQNAFGVQEAAQTYFSKNVEDLTIAEAALFAGIVKGPTIYSPYISLSPNDFDPQKHYEVGRIESGGNKYIAVYNPKSVERQHLVLGKMLELEMITQAQYDEAIAQDIKTSLKPGQKTLHDMSSYFVDYVTKEATRAIADLRGVTFEQAQNEVLTSGLKIYSTIDVTMQHKLEDIYNNFTSLLKEDKYGPNFINWYINDSGNIVDKNHSQTIYFKKDNVLNQNNALVIPSANIADSNGNLYIKANFLYPYPEHFDIADVYDINENNNLLVHTIGSVRIPKEYYSVSETNQIVINKSYFEKNPNFASFDENGNLIIPQTEFYFQSEGSLQPQSASVIIDYHTGHIVALVGGREMEVDGRKVLNRATDSPRQPGSSMKPIGAYLPALGEGYSAATALEDQPLIVNGAPWPRNWNGSYSGMMTLRRALEMSNNVVAVKTVDMVGIKTSMKYLEKLGIINAEHPERDNFITAEENPVVNDEALAALALGGLTHGVTPLDITAAYGAIANDGVYIKPMAFTKIVDRNDNTLIDNTPQKTQVVPADVAYIMKDMMHTTVTNGIAGSAAMNDFIVAGKTGTTTDNADIWFVGYTPYYVCGSWIGNDSPKITLANGSSKAIQLWKHIMTKVHEGLAPITSYPRPDSIVTASICTVSGKLVGPYCASDPNGTVVTEIFTKDTVPTEICDRHVKVKICKDSGKLAGEFCPEESVETRVMVKPPEGYVAPPLNPDGTNPDAKYNYAPTETCDIHTEEWSKNHKQEEIDLINELIDDVFGDKPEERPKKKKDKNNEETTIEDLLNP